MGSRAPRGHEWEVTRGGLGEWRWEMDDNKDDGCDEEKVVGERTNN